MAYADTAARSVLESWGQFQVVVAAAVKKGDLLGYNNGWVLADANGGGPAEGGAQHDADAGDAHVRVARGAVIEGPTGATAGGAIYLRDTAGGTSDTPSATATQVVGKAISATCLMLDPGRYQLKMSTSMAFAHGDAGKIIFVSPFACRVTKVSEVHATAAGQAGTLTVERLQGTEAPGAGDDLLGATKIDLTGTANTVQSPALTGTAAHLVLAAGDRLALKLASGASTTLAGACVTVEIERA